MARLFTSAASSRITTSIGANSATTFGTFVAVVKRTTDGSWHSLVQLNTSVDNPVFGMELSSSGAISMHVGSNDVPSPTIRVAASEGWVLVAATKATGLQLPRFHKYSFATGVWSHEDGTSSQPNPSTPSGSGVVTFGKLAGAGSEDYLNGTLSAVAVYNTVLSDAALEGMTSSLSSWMALSPTGMWVFNQASTATAVPDTSAQGANQTAITATSVTNDDPITGPQQPTFRAGTSGTSSASAVNLTVPAGVITGDRMIIVVVYKQVVASGALTTPSGWTVTQAATNGPTSSTMQGAIYTKIAAGTAGATSTDAGTTVQLRAAAGSQQMNAALVAYAGVDSIRTSNWVAGSNTASTTLPVTAPATAPQWGDLVVLALAGRGSVNGPSGSPSFSAPAGGASRAQSTNTSGASQNVGAYLGDHGFGSGSRNVTASATAWALAGQVILTGVTADPAVAFAALSDNFDDNTINTSKWPGNFGTVSEVGGRARVTSAAGQWSAFVSISGYQLLGSAVSVRIYPPPLAGGTANVYAQLAVIADGTGNVLAVIVDVVNNNIGFYNFANWVDAGAVNLTYSATDHAYARIREIGGSTYFETSSTGLAGSYIIQRTVMTSPAWVSDRNLAASLESHRDNGSTNYAEFDDFNITPTTVTYNGAAALSAASSLTAAAVPVRPAGATLSAASALTAAGTRGQPAAASLSSASALTAGGVRETAGAATLSAASALSAAAIAVVPGAVSLSAASALSAGGTGTSAAAASLSAASALSAVGFIATAGAATLSAASALSSAAGTIAPASASLSAASALSAAGAWVQSGAVALTAASALTASAAAIRAAAATLSAASSMTAAGTQSGGGGTALSAASGLSAGISATYQSAATLSAASALVAAGVPVRPGAAALSAASDLTATALRSTFAAATLSAASSLTAAGVGQAPAAVALTAGSSLSATATVTTAAAATLSAASSLTAAGIATRTGAVALTAGSSLTAARLATLGAAATLSAAGTMLVDPAGGALGAAALTATSTLTATAAVTRVSAAALSAASALVAAGVVVRPATATLSAASSLTATGVILRPAAASLSAASSLTAAAIQATSGSTALAAASGMTIAAAGGGASTATLSAASSLTITAVAIRPAAITMTVSSGLAATGGLQITAVVTLTAASLLAAEAEHRVGGGTQLSASGSLLVAAFARSFALATLSARSQLVAGTIATWPAFTMMSASSDLVALAEVAAPPRAYPHLVIDTRLPDEVYREPSNSRITVGRPA